MSTRKLLLADDSITIQKVVNLTFADEGIEVIAVSNGDSAMEKMAEISPDLVMADINMPGLTGYQVCERIKQNDNYKQTPVILLVGSFEPFDEEEAKRVGADDFLTKPFQSIRQLVSKVTVLLDANNTNAAPFQEATANNSFADTLDMNKPEITDSDQANDLGDAGMDDEMIQSAPVSSFALDESAKFETKDFAFDEDSEDYKRTQPLSVYDLKEFSFVADSPDKKNEPQIAENVYKNESESQDFYESVLEESEINNQSRNNSSSFLNSSDEDFLEIPFDEDDEWETEETAQESENNSTQSVELTQFTEENKQNASTESNEFRQVTEDGKSSPEIVEEVSQNEYSRSEFTEPEENYLAENEIVVGTLLEPEDKETESVSEERKAENSVESQSASGSETQFSSELIDAVARRVVEMLSDKVVREIAWEVVPQHADLIIKKAVEEKLKE